MSFSIFSAREKPGVPRLAQKEQNKFWLTVALCALCAALVFLPFQIVDGGFFHYAGDFNSQQITFYRYMNAFVKSGGTFSWVTDLGSGAANAYSFYLYGSPFFWLSLLFPQSWLPYLMCPLLVLKFAVAGGGAYLYLRRYAKDANFAVIGACLYAFSGFSLYNVFFNHFVDVVALFPYLLWALDECVYEKRRGWFAVLVALNLLNNYFFFVGQVLFLVIYFVCKLLSGDYRLTAPLFATLAFESLAGVGMGCVLAWPAVLSILQNPRTIDLSSGYGFLMYSKVQQYFAILLSWVMPPDSPYLSTFWSEGVIKWTSMTAYLPLCSLAGALAYGRSRRGDSFKKIVGTCAVFALVPVLNSAFYALNSSYYARWYYMPVLILCAMSLRAFEDADADLDTPTFHLAWIMAATAAFAVVPVHDDKNGWTIGVLQNPGQYAAVLGFGLLGLFLYWFINARWRGTRVYARRLLAGILAFACVFGVCHIGIGKFGQWNTDRDLVEQYNQCIALKAELPEGDYRIDTFECHDNLGVWLDKSSLQYFGSTAAPSILSFYPDVGVKRDVRSEPALNLYALRGLLSVEYMLMPENKTAEFEDKADDGWTLYDTKDGFALYRNENYVPMGFTYDSYVTREQFEGIAKAQRGNLLMRALLLSEEQIETYGALLSPLDTAQLSGLDYEHYCADAAARRASACESFTMTNTGFTASATLEKENLVFFSVPYDDGFTATVNGEAAEILNVDGGLMAVVCPAGEAQIVFRYKADGMTQSRAVTAGSAVLFVGYLAVFGYRKKKKLQSEA